MLSAVMAPAVIEETSDQSRHRLDCARFRRACCAAQGAFAKFSSDAEIALAGSADVALPALSKISNASLGPRFAGIKSFRRK